MPVSIIGQRASGKSTLVGFLHQMMEQYTVLYPSKFSYYMDPQTTDTVVTKIRNRMRSGKFPRATSRTDFKQLSFLMTYEASTSDVVKYITKNGLKSIRNIFNYDNKLIFHIHDISGEEIEEFGMNQEVTNRLKTVFDSNIFIILIDASKITKDLGQRGRALDQFDAKMSKILSSYEEYKSNQLEDEDSDIYPIVWFTKMDLLDDDIINDMPCHSKSELFDTNVSYDINKVNKDSEFLLSSYLTAIKQNLHGSKSVNVDLHKPRYFFSWAGLKRDSNLNDPNSEEKIGVNWYNIKTKHKEGMKRQFKLNEFPHNHYKEFIKYTRELSKDYDDPDKAVEKYLEDSEGLL